MLLFTHQNFRLFKGRSAEALERSSLLFLAARQAFATGYICISVIFVLVVYISILMYFCQEELVDNITRLVDTIKDVDHKFIFLEAFYEEIGKEWKTIDQWRMDKYLMVWYISINLYENTYT